VIKKALQSTLQELQTLNLSLWVQVGGMSASISFGMLLFSLHKELHASWAWGLILAMSLLIVLFSVSTFSIYLAKKGIGSADKLGLRKTLGTSGWRLFLEIAVRTTLLILISIILSIAFIDAATLMVGLKFEYILNNIGVIQFASLLLLVFILSEGGLFIIIAVALAPQIKANINETTLYEKLRFEKITKWLSFLSLVINVLIGILVLVLTLFYVEEMAIKMLVYIFYSLLIGWYSFNKYRSY